MSIIFAPVGYQFDHWTWEVTPTAEPTTPAEVQQSGVEEDPSAPPHEGTDVSPQEDVVQEADLKGVPVPMADLPEDTQPPAPEETQAPAPLLAEEPEKLYDNPLNVELTENRTYTAHFKPTEVRLPETGVTSRTMTALAVQGGSIEGYSSVPSDVNTDLIPAGSRGNVSFPFQLGGSLVQAPVKATLYEGADDQGRELLALNTIPATLDAGYGAVTFSFDPFPALPETATLELEVTGVDGVAQTLNQTYRLTQEESVENQAYAYLTSPSISGGTGAFTKEAGPNIAGAYAQVDETTKDLDLYLYGKNGVFTWDKTGAKDLAAMGNLPLVLGTYAGVMAVGPDGHGGLIAVVDGTTPQALDKVTTPGYEQPAAGTAITGRNFLYRWDGTAWNRVEGSCFSDYSLSEGSYLFDQPTYRPADMGGLVLSADDVWVSTYHWDGEAWAANGTTFNSFYRAGDSLAYAGSGDGLWQYDGTGWTRLGGLSGKWSIVSGAPGKLMVRQGNTYQVVDSANGAAQSLDVSGFGSLDVPTLGLDQNGGVYALVNGIYSGRRYDNYYGSYVYKLEGNTWVYQIMTDFNDPNESPTNLNEKIRPDGVTAMGSPVAGVSLMYGERGAGAIYLSADDVAVTFDARGGTFQDESKRIMTGPIHGEVASASVPIVAKDGFSFGGWYCDQALTVGWNPSTARMPGADMTLYAKWTEKGPGGGTDDPEMAYHREQALASLDKQFNKYNESDYTAESWKSLVAVYEQGKKDIAAAKPAPDFIENNIIAALNKALDAMQAVGADRAGKIDVVVSMDANTLGLGYLIKPTLVTVDDHTPASVVITDLIKDMVKDTFGKNLEGLSYKGKVKEDYAYVMTGSETSGFYLADVYYPKQQDAKAPDFITNASDGIDYGDSTDKYLGEFDYNKMSGWMYSIGGGSDYPSFPGVGASSWQLSNGEVMRWQFSVWGYGADLNADNSAWGTSSLVPDLGDKTGLTWTVAQLRDEFGYDDAFLEKQDAYAAAMKVLTDPEATQPQVNAADKALQAAKIEKPTGGQGPGGGKDEVTTVIKPEITVDKNGEAKAEITAKQVEEAIADAKENEATNIVIEPKINGEASKVSVELPKASVADIARDTDAKLTVKTGIADVSIPNAALAELAKESGMTVTISAETLKNKDGTASGQVDVAIKAGDKAIGKVSGGLTVKLPLKETTTGTVLMVVTDEGAKIVKKSVAAKGELTALLSGSAIVTVKDNTKTFSDMADDYWGRDAVNFAASHELFQGTGGSAFSPDLHMSRAMLVTVLHRLEDQAKADKDMSFPDVAGDTWYADAVAWAAANGIVTGTGSGFDPDGEITRESLAVILYRYAKAMKLDTTAKAGAVNDFADAREISGWAADAMDWAVDTGLLSGRDGKKLDPSGTATRAEVATILQRFIPSFMG